MTKPSELLLTKILHQLQEEQILTEQETNKISAKILSGKVKAEDWRLGIELSMEKEAPNGEETYS
jgi:hypothetical protein